MLHKSLRCPGISSAADGRKLVIRVLHWNSLNAYIAASLNGTSTFIAVGFERICGVDGSRGWPSPYVVSNYCCMTVMKTLGYVSTRKMSFSSLCRAVHFIWTVFEGDFTWKVQILITLHCSDDELSQYNKRTNYLSTYTTQGSQRVSNCLLNNRAPSLLVMITSQKNAPL